MAYIPEYDKANKKASPNQHTRKSGKSPYNNHKWRKHSFKIRTERIYCEECLINGRYILSKVLDHVIPVEKEGSFDDIRNHRAICEECHNIKRGKESHGYVSKSMRNENGELIPA